MARSYWDGFTILSRNLDDFDLKRLKLFLDEKDADRFENRLAGEDKLLAQGDGFKFTAMLGDAEYQFQYKRRKEVASFAGEFARLVHDRSLTVGARFTLIWIPESGYRLFVIPANVMIISRWLLLDVLETKQWVKSEIFEQKCFDRESCVDLVRFSAECRSKYARFTKCKIILVPELDYISLDEVKILKSYLDLHFSVIIISHSGISEHVLTTLVYELADGLVTVAAQRTDTKPRLQNFTFLPRGVLVSPDKLTGKQKVRALFNGHKLKGMCGTLVSPDKLEGKQMGFLSSVIFSETSLVLNE